jgi:hypothetical protein
MQRQSVLDLLHAPRFADQAPAESTPPRLTRRLSLFGPHNVPPARPERRIRELGRHDMTKTGPRDDAKVAAIKLEWWPRSCLFRLLQLLNAHGAAEGPQRGLTRMDGLES